jgi:hypothetical protein
MSVHLTPNHTAPETFPNQDKNKAYKDDDGMSVT